MVLESGETTRLTSNMAMTVPRLLRKSPYALWLRYFNEGEGSKSYYIMEVFLAYWIFWYVQPSGPKDGLNQLFS